MPLDNFHTVEQLGRTRSLTPEGFLLCVGVPISRCGTLLYAEHELDGLEGENGIIRVERLPDEVFAPKSIASFAGKPIIITHGSGFVTSTTWKQAAVGVVMNPRRGEGIDDALLIADLLITDQDAIDKVNARLEGHEVSAGYEAEYQQLAPGRARQYDIIGNHVALIDKGRCGPRCAIGDHAMPVSIPRKRPPAALLTVDAAAVRRAFKTRDEQALEDALAGEADDGMGGGPGEGAQTAPMPADGNGGMQHHITVNIHPSGATTEAGDKPAPVMDGGMPAPAMDGGAPPAAADPTAGMPPWAQAIMQRLDALEGAFAAMGGADAGADDMSEGGDGDGDEGAGAGDGDGDENPSQPTKDGMMKDGMMKGSMTKDSASLLAAHQDTVARAEILVPGMRMLTFDAAAPHKATFDSLCAFRRQVLGKAERLHGDALAGLLAGQDLRRMTCDAASSIFHAASEIIKAQNSVKTKIGFAPRMLEDSGKGRGALTPAEINAMNRKFHSRA